MISRASSALLALFLFVGAAPPDAGHIWIRTEPGIEVSLDGVPAGRTSEEEAGRRLYDIAAGEHQVYLEMPGAGSTTVKVEVVTGQTAIVTVSSMTLRAARRATASVEIDVIGAKPPCVASIGGKQGAIPTAETILENVPSGRQTARISCGAKSVEAIVDVRTDRTIIIRADFVSAIARVSGERPRVTDVKVRTARDVIAEAAIHTNAKRALTAAIAPGVNVVSIRAKGERGVVATFETRTTNAAALFVERLKERPEVREITLGSVDATDARTRIEVLLDVRP